MGLSAGNRAPPRTESRQKKAHNDLSNSASRCWDAVRSPPKLRILEDPKGANFTWETL